MEQTRRQNRNIILIIIAVIVIFIIIFALVFLIGKNRKQQVLTSSVTGCPTLDPPNNVTATQIDNQTITVTWNAVPGASRYKIFVGSSAGFSPTAALTTEITDTNHGIIPGLTLGHTYFIFVQTFNACNTPSIKSNETSIFMNFPSQFKIASRTSPFFTIAVNGTNADLEPDCQGLAGTAGQVCLFTYDPNTFLIKSVSQPTMCIQSNPDFGNADRLEMKLCSTILAQSDQTPNRWQYDQTLGALCHFPTGTNTTATQCAKLDGAFAANTPVRINGYDSSPQVMWDVLKV